MLLAITGAAGLVGGLIRPRLRRAGHTLRLTDIARIDDLAPGEEFLEASITDLDTMTNAFKDVDLVVHLAGHSAERPWEQILETNIHGGYVALEAAHRAGVRNILLGSSLHATGYVAAADAAAAPVLLPRPDTYYGVGKVALEALGSVYADRYGLSVVSARICTVAEDIGADPRTLSTWLSPDDLVRLIEVVGALQEPGHHVVWAVSDKTRSWFDLTAGKNIGFFPRDSAQSRCGENRNVRSDASAVLAGVFVDAEHPLGGTW
ncbi:NAD-dependent epimerase/dehydratase family protein [Kribbella sp. NPDC058245]|uniref:NAD-dependent epimerase/dehydratase family protein n=1 Tax=Kribbella sp. NPDC058245 TaxID=3346399 RepID=UPI0036EDBE17